MTTLDLSDLLWAALLAAFLILEIPAAAHLVGWDTLSRTAYLNERLHPWLKTLLFGFLIGLAVHIRYATGLWRTTLGGVLIAFVLNYLWR